MSYKFRHYYWCCSCHCNACNRNGRKHKSYERYGIYEANLLTVRSASANQGGVRQGAGSRPTLTLKDAIAINRLARGVEAVAPVSNQNQQVIYGNQNWSTTVYGTTGRYLGIKAYEILIGRNFTPEDIKNSTKVAIIGSTVSSELFGDVNPVGKTLRIGGVPFRVIAVLKTKGSTGPFDNDDLIFIPITTAQKKFSGFISREPLI